MSFYGNLKATAERLIAQYGKAAVLLRTTLSGPAHDPVETTVEHACTLVETGYSLTNRSDTLILAGDKVGIISTDLAVVPDKADKLRIGGDDYSLVDLQPLDPGGTVLLFEFVARR